MTMLLLVSSGAKLLGAGTVLSWRAWSQCCRPRWLSRALGMPEMTNRPILPVKQIPAPDKKGIVLPALVLRMLLCRAAFPDRIAALRGDGNAALPPPRPRAICCILFWSRKDLSTLVLCLGGI